MCLAKITFVFFLGLSFSIANASEKECTPINLAVRSKLGVSRDQGTIGWCYAHAAADVATRIAGKPISAADIALEFNAVDFISNVNREPFAEGGSPWAAFRWRSEKGFCLNKNFPVDEAGNTSLLSAHKTAATLKNNVYGPLGDRITQAKYAEIRAIIPNMDYQTFKQVFESSDEKNFYKNLREKACEPRIKLSKDIIPYFSRERAEIEKMINDQLNAGYPVIYAGKSECFKDNPTSDTLHAISIVGRMWENGECKYILRNSWGTGWGNQGKVSWNMDKIYSCKHQVAIFHVDLTGKGISGISIDRVKPPEPDGITK